MQDSTFIGLDVHKATISVAVARGERGGEARHRGTIPNRPDHVRKLAEKLSCDGQLNSEPVLHIDGQLRLDRTCR
ncbi:hypothetical protein Q4543_22800 [Salipiger sp. 1_MG-2023]|uniref:hypothetical protein n=1 Tax=Salipiger sp. 1_MG-2023 TaxID=3062665 RepID=UPI0026E4049E|nr:hypothetical protein [Salipiger sp. 1_MG-2023]MDO6588325.1 hypothetical protein [Salipiger sp. 1_MG-2023]